MKTLQPTIIAFFIILTPSLILSHANAQQGLVGETGYSPSWFLKYRGDSNHLDVVRGQSSGNSLPNGTSIIDVVYHGYIGEEKAKNQVTVTMLYNNDFVRTFSIPASSIDQNNGTFIFRPHIMLRHANDAVIFQFHYGSQMVSTEYPYVFGPTSLLEPGTSYPSPLSQFREGLKAKDVECPSDFELVIKTEDGSPACVGPKTAVVLIHRGWTSEFISPLPGPVNIGCTGTDVPPGNFRTSMIPVLVMDQNSTARVCVTYQFISDWDKYPNKGVYPHGIIETCCLVNNAKYSADFSANLTYTASRALFNATGVSNGTKIAVTYMIHAGPASRGFYDNSVPYGVCLHYPMAIGYGTSQINKSDFSEWVKLPPTCFYGIYKVDSVKIISGMNYTIIDFGAK